METKEDNELSVFPIDHKECHIFQIRGRLVIPDQDLEACFEVSANRLLNALKELETGFGDDLLIRLTKAEWTSLTFQIATQTRRQIQNGTSRWAITAKGMTVLSSLVAPTLPLGSR